MVDLFGTRYEQIKELPDGRIIGVNRLLFHWTLHVDIHEGGYEDRYCYQMRYGALLAMGKWDGAGDPEGWHRHPKSGRRRPGGDASKEYIDP